MKKQNSQRKKDNDETRNVHYLESRSKNRGRQINSECMPVDADTHSLAFSYLAGKEFKSKEGINK